MAQRQELDLYRDVANFRPEKNAKQVRAVEMLRSGKVKYFLYGGALGGGKSRLLRWYLVCRLIELFQKYGIKGIPAMLACEDYPSLSDRQLVKIYSEFPPWLGKVYDKHKVYGHCFLIEPEYGDGVLCFRNLDDPSKYQSSEWAIIAVDELTKNKYETFDELRMRLRYPGIDDMDCQFVAGTNPGGIGHSWVKQFWMDKIFPSEWTTPIDYRPTFAYCPALADDNPYLDKAYWAGLQTLPKHLQGPFRRGDWNIFLGQAFQELSKQIHSYRPGPKLFPDAAPVYMTMDWGFGKPFSVGWWHTDADGRVYRAARWYGWNGTPDTGLRLEDSIIARTILAKEEEMGIRGRVTVRLAGPDCFQKKPNYMGGGQGPSTSETFAKEKVYLTVADVRRDLKIRQFRERIRWQDERGQRLMPMMLINEADDDFWRTVPNLIMDKNDIEDVDTKGEDHVFDEVCHIAMARPMSLRPQPTARTMAAVRIDLLEKRQIDMDQEYLERETAQSQGFWDSQADAPATEYHIHDVE